MMCGWGKTKNTGLIIRVEKQDSCVGMEKGLLAVERGRSRLSGNSALE